MSVQLKVQQLLEPLITDLGYELVLLEFTGAGKAATIRIFIDKLASNTPAINNEVDGEGTEATTDGLSGITLSDCETVSREVSAVLDVEDVITYAYRLEVSSPGLDRPLTKPAHWVRFVGQEVKVQCNGVIEGRRRLQGILQVANDTHVTVLAEGKNIVISYAQVDKARLVPKF